MGDLRQDLASQAERIWGEAVSGNSFDVLGVVALLAFYPLARRAARVDPLVALRYE